jgi:hypothetical protein
MSALNRITSILKGVMVDDEAKYVGTEERDGALYMVFELPDGRVQFVDAGAGVFPNNPDDPHHGMGIAPFYDEGGGHGYHPDGFEESHDPESRPKTSMLAQMKDEARTDASEEPEQKVRKAEQLASVLLHDILVKRSF